MGLTVPLILYDIGQFHLKKKKKKIDTTSSTVKWRVKLMRTVLLWPAYLPIWMRKLSGYPWQAVPVELLKVDSCIFVAHSRGA